ncbi:FG-GAP repeat domain-containing protein [Cystobacter fuscus]
MKTSAKSRNTRRMNRRVVVRSSVALALSTLVACQGTADESGEGLAADGSQALVSSAIAPTLKWAWTGSEVLPDYKQVMTTPVVIDLNRDNVPDIVFSTFAGSNYGADGVLRAISGNDGHELWTVTETALRVKAAAGLTAGDIDGDGLVEVCAIPENGRGVICFTNEGAFKLRTPEGAYDYNEWGGPALADLDGDGRWRSSTATASTPPRARSSGWARTAWAGRSTPAPTPSRRTSIRTAGRSSSTAAPCTAPMARSCALLPPCPTASPRWATSTRIPRERSSWWGVIR